MIILATRALADAMIGCWAVLFDAALGPRGQKDDDAAVPFDAAALHAIDATSADGVATRSREL